MKIAEMKVFLPKYGVTEYKKRELDYLSIQVLDAENEVTQLQAIVTSLTQKSATFQSFLAIADANRATALNNKNLVDAVVKNATDLQANSSIAFNEMVIAKAKAVDVAKNTNSVLNKLIYTAESINKLANLVVRKKAQNPLISDELVSMITTAGTDANNAVALALVALKSTFAAQASNQDSEAAATLEYTQSMKLLDVLTINADNDEPSLSLQHLLHGAYEKSKHDYIHAQDANNETLNQLNLKTAELKKAQVNLKSLQSGFAAANAAALAS
jgi:hypothetical protein